MSDARTRNGRTQALFRDVNERVAEAAHRFESDDARFVCECGDGDCTARIEARLDEYERVRSESTHFLVVPGHEDTRVERVVRARRRYAVVERAERKVAAVVRRLDRRAAHG